MADISDSTHLPVCALATTAIDAIARVRTLVQTVSLALAGFDDERISLAVIAVIRMIDDELAAAEETLDSCARPK